MWLINATPFAGSVLRRCGSGCLGMLQIRGARSFVTSNRLAGGSCETSRDHCVFRGPGDRNCLATTFYILEDEQAFFEIGQFFFGSLGVALPTGEASPVKGDAKKTDEVAVVPIAE